MTIAAVVTGADKGLGLCLSRRLLAEGYRVFAGQYQAGDSLERLGQDYPHTLTQVPLDVADSASVRAATALVASLTPNVDVLINNAGIYPSEASSLLGALDFEVGRRVYEVNALGPLRVTESLLGLMEQGTRKLVINISSEAGSITDCWRTGVYFYCMSKAALNMQSKILKNLLGPRGFTVLTVHPGWMRTDMSGPGADIDPAEAAEGIFELTRRDWQAEDPMYVDHRGKPLPW